MKTAFLRACGSAAGRALQSPQGEAWAMRPIAPVFLLALLALTACPARAQVIAASFPGSSSATTLTVNRTTGAIVGPVSAATFKSANSIGTGGGGSYTFTAPLVDTAGTVTINNAAADGATKGAAAFAAADFDASAGVISLDYTNGQKATSSLPGLLSAADWVVFNAKVPATRTVNGHALSGDVTVTKSDVGLSNADNTSDAAKPVSTATQTALDLKASLSALAATNGSGPNAGNGLVAWTQLTGVPAGFADGTDDGAGGGSGTVTSVSSGNLAPLFTVGITNPTTTPAFAFTLSNAAQNAVLAGPSSGGAGAPSYRALALADMPGSLGTWGGITPSANVQSLAAAADYAAMKVLLSLDNVNNTTDANKPISNATQTALDLKVATTTLNSQMADPSTNGSFAAVEWRKDIGVANYTAHGATGATETIDPATAEHSLTLDANCTFSFGTWPSSGNPRPIMLEILQDATGSRTATWPASVVTPPTLNPTANSVTFVLLYSRDGGTTVFATSDYAPISTVPGLGANVAAALGVAADASGGFTRKAYVDAAVAAVVSSAAYDATSWNGSALAPDQNAVRDKIESLTTANVAASTDKNYVTDAQQTVIGNTSGTNTGDQTNVTGNAGTATALQTARTIGGTSFNGTTNIDISSVPTASAADNDTSPASTAFVQAEHARRPVAIALTIDTLADSLNYGKTFIPAAFTVAKIVGVHVGAGLSSPSVVATLKHGTDRTTGTTIEAVTVTSSTTGTVVTTGFDDATIPANSFVWVETSAKSGTTANLEVYLIGTYD